MLHYRFVRDTSVRGNPTTPYTKKKFVNPDASLSFRSGHECSWRHFYALHPKTIREITPENTFSINTPNFAQPIHK